MPLPVEEWKQYKRGNLGERREFGFGSFETGAPEEDSGDVPLAVMPLGLEHRIRSGLNHASDRIAQLERRDKRDQEGHEEPWHLNSQWTRKAEGEKRSEWEPRQNGDPGAMGEKCLHIRYIKLLKRKILLAWAARK